MKSITVLASVLAFFAGPDVAEAGGFLSSCCQVSVTGTTVTTVSARCLNNSGQLISTSIDLNRCLTNNNGNLAFMVK